MVGNVLPADGAEVDRVVALEGFESVVGHHLAGLGVVPAAPGEFVPLEGELAGGLFGQDVQYALARLDDLATDTVSRDRCDLVGGEFGSHEFLRSSAHHILS